MQLFGKTVSMGLANKLYASLTLNWSFLPPFQETESSSKEGLWPLKTWSKSPTISNSQSLKSFKKLRFQPPWPKFWSHISSTVAFLCTAMAKRWGKLWDSAIPAHQTSVQNLILVPFPAMSTILSQHQSVSFKISFQTPYSKRPINLLCLPTKTLLPIFRQDHLLPKIVFITNKSPYPFTKQGFAQKS